MAKDAVGWARGNIKQTAVNQYFGYMAFNQDDKKPRNKKQNTVVAEFLPDPGRQASNASEIKFPELDTKGSLIFLSHETSSTSSDQIPCGRQFILTSSILLRYLECCSDKSMPQWNM